jgi:hypothetical protein
MPGAGTGEPATKVHWTLPLEELGLDSRSVEELLPLIASKSASVRDGAALELRDLAESGVHVPVEPILAAIKDPANRDHRGTLVYALEAMDCSQQFECLFDLALHGDYEVSLHAYTILSEQPMAVTLLMVQQAEAKLSSLTPPSHMTEEDAALMKAELAEVLARLGDGSSGAPNV